MAVTGAELLNEKWEALSDRFNLLKSVPRDQADLINAAISDWQDFYWDKFEAWGDLTRWQDLYVKTARLLDGVAAKTVTVKTVQQTDAYSPPKRVAVVLPPLLVTGQPPPPKATAMPPMAGVGPVDTSGWRDLLPADFGQVYEVTAAPGWTPPDNGTLPINRSGLWALLGGVLAFMGLRRGGML